MKVKICFINFTGRNKIMETCNFEFKKHKKEAFFRSTEYLKLEQINFDYCHKHAFSFIRDEKINY